MGDAPPLGALHAEPPFFRPDGRQRYVGGVLDHASRARRQKSVVSGARLQDGLARLEATVAATGAGRDGQVHVFEPGAVFARCGAEAGVGPASGQRCPACWASPAPGMEASEDGARHLAELTEAVGRATDNWMPAVSADAVRWVLELTADLQQQRDAALQRAEDAEQRRLVVEASHDLALDVLSALRTHDD